MCEAHAVAFALVVVAAFAVVVAADLAVAVLWRSPSLHAGSRSPRMNALQPAATWFAGFGPRRAPVGIVAGLLMRS